MHSVDPQAVHWTEPRADAERRTSVSAWPNCAQNNRRPRYAYTARGLFLVTHGGTGDIPSGPASKLTRDGLTRPLREYL